MPSYSDLCRCSSGKTSESCCQPYLDGSRQAPTAEALMRSRYVAYGKVLQSYLLATWHPSTRPDSLGFDKEPPLNWIGLAVKRHEQQGIDNAIVEFVARYKIGGRAYRLHETSRFVRESGCWFYVSGDINE